ncbi:Putative protein C18orf25 like protein [Chelonia mydas]|uniref:E3 ubiquitin-protein ligase Arkadia N-terminal domain-containing protein n=1 Tax=Chelonia mydas TaxID=8469 RepID=M7C6J6_CHEMY|nr:Putative protein C18orf25 like protein [Chelonia mydas]
MKMEAVGKVEERIDSEVSPKLSEKQEAAPGEDGPIELDTCAQKDGVPIVADSMVLSSMPCLLMELRRDSSESQLASTESDKPTAGQIYESDSSNHCMLSPSSSGHLADSDTLSSAEENEPCQAEAPVEGDPSGVSGAAAGRKSRRSRSESETSTMAAKKNRQSSDKQNGRVTKVKGHRSQKHKERIRLLRQKREAAARKKYNLLQDSSTSDSDLTCDSSTSSSEDDEEVSGSSKTITAEIPGADRGLRMLPPPQARHPQLPLAGNCGQWELQVRHLQMGQYTELLGRSSVLELEEGHAAASGSCLSLMEVCIISLNIVRCFDFESTVKASKVSMGIGLNLGSKTYKHIVTE